MAPVILGYWNIRGLAQSIRNILEYTGEAYEDKTYDFDMSNPEDLNNVIASWRKDKTEAPFIVGGDGEEALEFPNLPYYIETLPDGSKLKLSQSLAIIKHIGRKHGLVAEGDQDIAKLDMYEQQIMDLRQAIIGYCYENPMATYRYPNYPEDIQGAFKQFEKVLQNKKWILGDKLTYVDFIFFEVLDWHVLLKEDILDSAPEVKAYYERFKEIPKIAEYFASGRYKSWPLVSPFAKKFGYIK